MCNRRNEQVFGMEISDGNLQESLRHRITIPNVSAAGFLLLTLVTSGQYGFYGDELYYFACSKHLAWGYVDHPPLVALLTFVGTQIFIRTCRRHDCPALGKNCSHTGGRQVIPGACRIVDMLRNSFPCHQQLFLDESGRYYALHDVYLSVCENDRGTFSAKVDYAGCSFRSRTFK